MSDALNAWQSWYELCALQLTPEAFRTELCTFGLRRFRLYTRRYAHLTNHPGVVQEIPDAPDCFHRFETWCMVRNRRDGKRYKDWMFHRGEGSLADVESAASLLMRDAVRDWLRTEFSSSVTDSMSRSLSDSGLTLEALLASPDAALADVPEDAVHALVRQVADGLEHADCVALVARRHQIPLSRGSVTTAAGVGKSALSQRYRNVIERIGNLVNEQLADRSPDESVRVSLLVLDQVSESISSNILPEISDSASLRGQA